MSVNKITVKMKYKEEEMTIELPEEMVKTFDANKLGTVILYTWSSMINNADRPIPIHRK